MKTDFDKYVQEKIKKYPFLKARLEIKIIPVNSDQPVSIPHRIK